MYAITANVEYTTPDGMSGSRALPTFYLDENVQGITNEQQAVRIATYLIMEIASAANLASVGTPYTHNNVIPHITAVKVLEDCRMADCPKRR